MSTNALDSVPLAAWVWLVQMAAFHVIGYGFQWCDRSGALRRFKVRNVDAPTYRAMLPRVLFNQTFILLPAMLGLEWLGLAFTGTPRLSLPLFAAGLVLMPIGHDLVQYAAHRWLLHNRHLRWLGHDVHHSTNASRSIGALYMSAGDFFLNITCPYLIPLVLIGGGGADWRFHFLIVAMGTVGGLYEHSGYDFATGRTDRGASPLDRVLRLLPPSLVSSHAHAEHHRRWHVSYSDGFGSPGLCDLVFRTRWDLRR